MSTETKMDLFQIITDKIIAHLENGTVPWRKPWAVTGPPINMLSRRKYKGINYLLLNSLGYEHNYFLTFNQIQSLGATIIKGEKSEMIVFWEWPEKKEGETAEEFEKRYPKLHYHRVFNIEQCENIPENFIPESRWRENSTIEVCEEIVREMPNPPVIVHKEQRAYYNKVHDYINMPQIDSFENSDSYYGILFHEMIHSTGHSDRLARKELMESSLEVDLYSIEELTAEIGSCFLKSHAGIAEEQIGNSAAYIDHWLNVLRNNKKFIFYASSQAQKAVHYIIGTDLDEVQSEKEFVEEDLPY